MADARYRRKCRPFHRGGVEPRHMRSSDAYLKASMPRCERLRRGDRIDCARYEDCLTSAAFEGADCVCHFPCDRFSPEPPRAPNYPRSAAGLWEGERIFTTGDACTREMLGHQRARRERKCSRGRGSGA